MTGFAQGALISTLGQFFGRGIYILTQIFLARKLGPDGFGLYALGWTAVRIASTLSIFGLDISIVRFGSANYLKNDSAFRANIKQSFRLATIFGLVSTIALFLLSPHLAYWFKSQALTVIFQFSAICLFFYTLSRLISSTILATQQIAYSVGLNEFIQPLSNFIFAFLALWLGYGVASSTFALLMSFIVTFLVGLLFLKQLLPELFTPIELDPSLVKPLLKFSLPVAITSLVGLNILWIDRVIVGFFETKTALGAYQAASQSSLLFATILAGMNAIFMPMIADLLSIGQKGQLERLFQTSTKWGFYLSLPIASILFLKPEAFLTFVFGSEYSHAYRTIQVLTFAQLINVSTGAVNLLLIMGGYQVFWMLISALMLLVNIALGIILVPRYGIIGAAWGTAVSQAGLGLCGLVYVKLKLNMWPYARRYLKGISAITVSTLSSTLVHYNWQLSSPALELLMTSIIVCSLFLAILWFLGFDQEDWTFINIVQLQVQKLFSFRFFKKFN